MAKTNLKEKAIMLRKEGLSYREIMQQMPIAKSTLSDWLRSVGLAKHQVQRLTEKKLAAARRGAEARHMQRISTTEAISKEAKSDIGVITPREFLLIGAMLYWAEGSKQKEHAPSARVGFTNSDPDMIVIFLRWLKEICKIDDSDIVFDICIHELHRHRTIEIVDFWVKIIGCEPDRFQHIYYKRGNPKTLRKNVGRSYHGVFRVSVKSSTALNRKIAGWARGVVESIR